MKKVISLLLALIMIFTTASAYSNDNDNISVAHAQDVKSSIDVYMYFAHLWR